MDDCEIIILNSPIYINSTDDGEEYLPPLGQGYIASQLIKDGIHVEIIDCINERNSAWRIETSLSNGGG